MNFSSQRCGRSKRKNLLTYTQNLRERCIEYLYEDAIIRNTRMLAGFLVMMSTTALSAMFNLACFVTNTTAGPAVISFASSADLTRCESSNWKAWMRSMYACSASGARFVADIIMFMRSQWRPAAKDSLSAWRLPFQLTLAFPQTNCRAGNSQCRQQLYRSFHRAISSGERCWC